MFAFLFFNYHGNEKLRNYWRRPHAAAQLPEGVGLGFGLSVEVRQRRGVAEERAPAHTAGSDR